jgi:hypothetical protein
LADAAGDSALPLAAGTAPALGAAEGGDAPGFLTSTTLAAGPAGAADGAGAADEAAPAVQGEEQPAVGCGQQVGAGMYTGSEMPGAPRGPRGP